MVLQNSINQSEVNNSIVTQSATPFQTSVGSGALSTSTGTNNVGVGYNALNLCSTGSSNVAVGSGALAAATTASNCVALGYNALTAVTTGIHNIGIGSGAAVLLTGGYENIAIGTNSLASGATCLDNVCIGYNAGQKATGSHNVFIGMSAGLNNVQSENVAIGESAFGTSTGASTSVLVGYRAGFSLTNGDANTAVGHQSLYYCQGGARNTAVGTSAFTGVAASSPTDVTAIGYRAAYTNRANYTTAVGASCLSSNSTGIRNTGVGYATLLAVSTGSDNTGYGYHCLNTTNSSNNTGVGSSCFDALGAGSNNTGVGYHSGNVLLTGSNNSFLGYNTGTSYTTNESNNILIGAGVTGTAAENTTTRIGIQGTQTACYIAGIDGVTVTGATVLCSTSGQLGDVVSAQRFKENIEDMGDVSSPIMNLRPRKFNYISDPSKSVCYGFIAEEVVPIFNNLVLYDENGATYSVKYHELPPLIINEMQKMAARISALEQQLQQG